MKMLYLIRGLPGSGKSTLAKTLGASLGALVWEADQYHMRDGVYDWKAENQYAAHKWCQCGARGSMELGHSNVIVSNTSTTEKELKPYLEMAKEFGYAVTSIIVENRHGNESIHNVPEETMAKMRQRFSVKL
jgi:predicted kinase